MHASHRINGLTLIELIITITLIGIFLAIAIPSFYTVIQNNYSRSLSNDLISALQFSRSEAIKRDTNVSVCATSSSSFSSCGSSWALGWIIFVDISGNGVYNAGADTILRTVALTGQNGVVTSTPSVNSATFGNSGFPSATTSNVTFTVSANGCSGSYAHTIAVSMTGRLNVTTITCP